MYRVCGARWDQVNIDCRACRPGVPFVDVISMCVDQNGMIEMCARLDGTASAVRRHPTPKNHAAIFIRRRKLEPAIESVHGAARKEMTDLARSHHHVHARCITSPHRRRDAIE